MKKHKRVPKILTILLGVILGLILACAVYVQDYYHALPEAAEAMNEEPGISIETPRKGVTAFVPEDPIAGLIFYPGGKVEAKAYAPLLKACAQENILCLLVRMPGNLAVLKPNSAEGLQEMYPQIEHWYIGGHSLGGSMAAIYTASHAQELEGLLLLAAYSSKDLSGTDLKVLSIYGSEDGVMGRDSYDKYRTNLPMSTKELVLQGGCHAWFGSYGVQKGDGTPLISGQEQQQQTVTAVAEWIKGQVK